MRKFTALMPLLALFWAVSASAHGPVRQKTQEAIVINAPADKVWEIIKAPCGIKDWHPQVAGCDAEGSQEEGAKRKLTLVDEGWVNQELKKYDEKKKLIGYKFNFNDVSTAQTIVHAGEEIQVPMFPVANYSDMLFVKSKGADKSQVVWRGAFYRAYMNNNPPAEMNEEAAINTMNAFYRSGLEGLKQLLEK
ncbi:MAG: hypothetical protein Kow0060_07990 [Methylohalobius crimeensis]